MVLRFKYTLTILYLNGRKEVFPTNQDECERFFLAIQHVDALNFIFHGITINPNEIEHINLEVY